MLEESIFAKSKVKANKNSIGVEIDQIYDEFKQNMKIEK